jgi:uncharacterized membrane-anchored protein
VVFLGIVLAVAAVGVGIGVVAENSSSGSLSVFGQQVPGVHTEAQVFIVGLAVATLVIAGLLVSSLERKNQQLQRELARARGGAPSAPATEEQPVWPRQSEREPTSPFFDHTA